MVKSITPTRKSKVVFKPEGNLLPSKTAKSKRKLTIVKPATKPNLRLPPIVTGIFEPKGKDKAEILAAMFEVEVAKNNLNKILSRLIDKQIKKAPVK